MYLKEVGSDLHKNVGKVPLVDSGQLMNIVDGAEEFVKLQNVNLRTFHDEPRNIIPGLQIGVLNYFSGPGGDELIEKQFMARCTSRCEMLCDTSKSM